MKSFVTWFWITLIELSFGMVLGDLLVKQLNAWVHEITRAFSLF